jgi:hypothetical protein
MLTQEQCDDLMRISGELTIATDDEINMLLCE